jgi:hypothetical protein
MWDNIFDMIEDMQSRVLAGEIVHLADSQMDGTIGFQSALETWEMGIVTAITESNKQCKTARHRATRKLFKNSRDRARLCLLEVARELRDLDADRI